MRLGVVQGEYHWHKHDKDDEFDWLLVRNRPEFGPFIPAGAMERLYRDVLVRYINFLSTHIRVEAPLTLKAGAVGLRGPRLAHQAESVAFFKSIQNHLDNNPTKSCSRPVTGRARE